MECFRQALVFALTVAVVLVAPRARAEESMSVRSGSAKKQDKNWIAGANGADFDVAPGIRATLSPHGHIELVSNRSALRFSGNSRTRTIIVRLHRGVLDIDAGVASDGAANAVLVRAPLKLSGLVVRGRLLISAGMTETAIAAMEGEVRFATNDNWKPLKPGQVRVARLATAGVTADHLLAAPTVRSARRVFNGVDENELLAGFSWTKITAAAGYRVELTRAGERPAIAVRREETNHSTQGFRSPGAGSYDVRVAAIDRFGLPGMPSDPVEVSVVGVQLPPGARVDEFGVIRALSHQSVTLTNVEELLVLDRKTRSWVEAPSIIPMTDTAKSVRLRHPDSPATISLRLKPVDLQVAVSLRPSNVRWPGPPVHARIEAYDDSGKPYSDGLELNPVVTVGVEPVEVEWARDHHVLSADVPYRSGAGPWVVRVEVYDPAGYLLGRNFMEIAAQPQAKPPQSPQLPVVARTR